MVDVVSMKKENSDSNSQWWWIDSHHHQSSRRSPWLQSTLCELDNKTKAMLKLIEEDADSFAQRAEMYYRKRPELISMVEEFYRAHRSLVERYDQLKPDSGIRRVSTMGSSFSTKIQPCVTDHPSDSHSEACEHDDFLESEVDDPEQDCVKVVDSEIVEFEEPEQDGVNQVDEGARKSKTSTDVRMGEAEAFSEVVNNDEMVKLKCEVERLKEENKIQKDQLMEKDEEKREVIRQLSTSIELLRLDNVNLSKCASAKAVPKKHNRFDFVKFKEIFSWKIFNRTATPSQNVVSA